jgi:hypothetical protein
VSAHCGVRQVSPVVKVLFDTTRARVVQGRLVGDLLGADKVRALMRAEASGGKKGGRITAEFIHRTIAAHRRDVKNTHGPLKGSLSGKLGTGSNVDGAAARSGGHLRGSTIRKEHMQANSARRRR